MKKIHHKTKEAILRAKKKGISARLISQKYNISPATIYKYTQENRITWRPKKKTKFVTENIYANIFYILIGLLGGLIIGFWL